MFHTTAWVLWLAAALLPFTLTKNPFYILIALGAIGIDYYVLCRNSALGKSWGALLSLGITLALFSILYNVLFVSVGATKLLTLPVFRWEFSEGVVQLGAVQPQPGHAPVEVHPQRIAHRLPAGAEEAE